jgi:hypothetical protein
VPVMAVGVGLEAKIAKVSQMSLVEQACVRAAPWSQLERYSATHWHRPDLTQWPESESFGAVRTRPLPELAIAITECAGTLVALTDQTDILRQSRTALDREASAVPSATFPSEARQKSRSGYGRRTHIATGVK